MLIATDLVGTRVRFRQDRSYTEEEVAGREGVVRIVDSGDKSVYLVVQFDDGMLSEPYRTRCFEVLR
jgi:hypothetical protein